VVQSDATTFAKVRQQCAVLKVHIDSADDCAQTFIDSLKFAGLAAIDGDRINIAGLDAVPRLPQETTEHGDDDAEEDGDDAEDVPPVVDQSEAAAANGQGAATKIQPLPPAPPPATPPETPSARSVIHINVNLDSSLDTEKLEKQLALLRRYGAL
jgi:hypothetical protein